MNQDTRRQRGDPRSRGSARRRRAATADQPTNHTAPSRSSTGNGIRAPRLRRSHANLPSAQSETSATRPGDARRKCESGAPRSPVRLRAEVFCPPDPGRTRVPPMGESVTESPRLQSACAVTVLELDPWLLHRRLGRAAGTSALAVRRGGRGSRNFRRRGDQLAGRGGTGKPPSCSGTERRGSPRDPQPWRFARPTACPQPRAGP
jgi:hypothetical protein